MCYGPCLNQAIHSLFEYYIYVSITLIFFQVILVYDLLRNDLDCYLVIFGLLNWIVDMYNKVFSTWGGE